MRGWRETYHSKLTTAEEAVKRIRSGDRIYTHSASVMPTALLEALAKRRDELEDVTVYGCQSTYPFSFLQSADYRGRINYVTNFHQGYDHVYFPVGNTDILSAHYSKLSRSLLDVYRVNVLMIEVPPPDEEGYFSFGVIGTAMGWDVAQRAERIILQVNRNQPRPGPGPYRLHIDEIDCVVESDSELAEFRQPEVGEVDRRIAGHILPLIPDGATLQLGLGGLSNAVGYGLEGRKNLSVHTEMYTDSMMYLSKKGVITGTQVAAFGQGSRELYEYIAGGKVQFRPISLVNDPVEIAKNDNMISINACLMSDLTGQVCSESIGFRQYSCTGGQLDFVRGAAMSRGGKSFLCLNSTRTDKAGRLHSKITLDLPRGAVVTTPRSDVMYIVTEYGVADLYLRTIEDRVHAMIAIAHPDFRASLREEAVREGLIRD